MATSIEINTTSAVQALKDLKEEQKKVKQELKGLQQGTVEYADATNKLNEINSKLEGAQGFRQLRQEQQALRNQLAGLTAGTQEYIDTSNRLGEVSNRINDINDTVSSVSNSPIENLSNSFGLLSGQVMNLDFDGAAQSLSTFGAGIKNVKIGDLTNGLKAFGKGLLDIGKALLANPIFYLVAAVTAIGTAMYALKDKIKPIGVVFDAIGDAIGFVVQQFKDLSDWIGFSAFAAEEAAEKQINAAKATEDAVVSAYDKQIAVASAAGKKTEELEKQKQIAVLNSAKLQIEAIKSVATANGKYTEEQIKQLEDLGKTINAADTALKVAEAKRQKDKEDEDKKKNDDAKKNAEKQLSDNDKLNKQILEQELNLQKDLEVKALQKAANDKAQRDKDIKNSSASADVKNKALLLSLKTYNDDVQKVVDEQQKKAEEDRQKDADKQLGDLKDLHTQIKDVVSEPIAVDINFDYDTLNDNLVELGKSFNGTLTKMNEDVHSNVVSIGIGINDLFTNLIKAQREQINTSELEGFEKSQAQIQNVSNYAVAALSAISGILDAVAANNKAKLEENLDNIKDSQEQEIASVKAKYDAGIISKEQFEEQSKAINDKAKAAELAAKKKAFEQDKKMKIAQAVISGLTGAVSAFTGAMQLGPIAGPIVGAVLAAAVGVMTGINVANIKKTKFDDGGSAGSIGGGIPSTASNINTASASNNNQSTLFSESLINNGNNNTQNDGTKTMTQGSAVKVYVTETDISQTQNKVKVIENQAKF